MGLGRITSQRFCACGSVSGQLSAPRSAIRPGKKRQSQPQDALLPAARPHTIVEQSGACRHTVLGGVRSLLDREPIKSLDGTDRCWTGRERGGRRQGRPHDEQGRGIGSLRHGLGYRNTCVPSGAHRDRIWREIIKLKMPARRMGASFGPNNELVVFWRLAQSVSAIARLVTPGVASSSRSASRAPTDMTAGARSKSKRRMKRSQSKGASRPSTAGTQEGDSDGARGRKGADEGEEESRFLRSYTALSERHVVLLSVLLANGQASA